jgi:hypothetical protein
MALRLDDPVTLAEAVAVSEATRWAASAAFEATFDWTAALQRDASGAAVEVAAGILEEHGYVVRAASAWADAALLAERAGRTSRAGERAADLAESIGLYPLIETLGESTPAPARTRDGAPD